jgi:4-amino-4-deoxy-L-arabinose transferase-like glycosyltransferase
MFAQNMLREGPSVFPQLYGQPYPDYPSGSTVLMDLAAQVPGRVTPLTAILPTAVTSALVLMLTYRLAAFHSPAWGAAVVFISLLTNEFVSEARSISLDQYTTLATVGAFYLLYTADLLQRPRRRWVLPLVFVAGFAFRGPIGLVVPAAVSCAYLLARRDVKWLLTIGASAAIVFALCLVLLMAAAHREGGPAFANTVLKMQITGRVESDVSPLFYWLRAPLDLSVAYPLAALVALTSLRRLLRRPDSELKLVGQALLWAAVVMVGLSIPGAKKTRYLLPAVPALVLVASYLFVDPSPRPLVARVRVALIRFAGLFPILSFLAVPVVWLVAKRVNSSADAPYPPVAVALGMVALLSWLIQRRSVAVRPVMPSLAVAAVAFLIVEVGLIEPILCSTQQTGPFMARVTALAKAENRPVVYYGTRDANDIGLLVHLDRPVQPALQWESLSRQPTACIISTAKSFAWLPSDMRQRALVRLRAKAGRQEYVVFTLDTP